MKKVAMLLISVIFLTNCSNSHSPRSKKNIIAIVNKDSIKKQQAVDSMMKLGDRPDTEQEGPTFDEVKLDLLSSYNKIERIDTMVIIGNDSLHIREKYYCLHDSTRIIPKKYLWGGDTSKDFVTHNFASNILIIKNHDTIINKTFRVSDFNKAINPEEKKYATVMFPNFSGYKKKYNSVIFCYSITIPLTDVGVSACIAIDLNGQYKILDEYAKINDN